MARPAVPPALITPEEVKAILGRVPRTLENMVVYDKKDRKLYRYSQVKEIARRENRDI